MKDSWDASSSEDESSEVAEPEPTKSVQKATAAQNRDETPDDSESEGSDESDDESDDEESEEDEDTRTDAEIKKEKAWQRITVSSSQCFD